MTVAVECSIVGERWSGQTVSDLKVGDRRPTGGRLGDCFARYGPQRNAFPPS